MVNTFITSMKLSDTFKDLDYRRLGKQRLEAKQIINVLEKIDSGEDVSGIGFASHTATKMWIGYTNALKAYYNLCLQEWIDRGYKNNMVKYDVDETKFTNRECEFDGKITTFTSEETEFTYPPFASFKPFILSHRSALYKKDPKFYSKFLDEELEPYIEHGYLWPTHAGNEIYNNWNLNYLDKPGAGAPAQYRIPLSEATSWVNNKLKNPKTNRTIKENGPKYKEFETAAKFYKLI